MASKTDASDDMIVFEGISKDYRGAVALQSIDLTVRRGEFLSLLGPSGSGKSTVLNIISGAVAPSSGRLLIDGVDMSSTPPRERGLGMVFQNYALLPHLSVFDNVAFPLRIRGLSRRDIEVKVRESLECVGLNGFENRKPRELSGGQQQRVGIARCIVYSPSIILMDEPLGALDKKLRDQLQREIKRLHKDIGKTLVYVTHDQEEALNLSDRICLMHGGRIEQHGTPDQLYFEPASTFVADFVGESNLFDAVVMEAGLVKTLGGEPIRVNDIRGRRAGEKVKVLIRPEKITLGREDVTVPATANRAAGTVSQVSFVGGMTRVEIRTRAGEQMAVKRISQRSDTSLDVGAPVGLHWEPADCVVVG